MVLGAYTRLQNRRRRMNMTRHTAVKTDTGMNVVPNLPSDDPLLPAVWLRVPPPEESLRAAPCLGSWELP